MIRVVYMGTPAYAVPPLRELCQGDYETVLVVTPPDRPTGRSSRPRPSAVKAFALEHGLPIWQPDNLRSTEAVARLRTLAPEVIVVAAYGEILRPAVLEIPPHGCLNLHASLLPRHRGAAPVVSTILAGDAQAGVTLMLMDAGMDSGPILAQQTLPLTGEERQGGLTGRLSEVGAALLLHTLPGWLTGEIRPQPQDESKATYCSPLRKEDGEINWSQPASYIERMTRAYDPWPGAYTYLRGKRLRVWQASALAVHTPLSPGTASVQDNDLLVGTGEGPLRLEKVQLEGRRPLSAAQFLLGQRDIDGAQLGEQGQRTTSKE